MKIKFALITVVLIAGIFIAGSNSHSYHTLTNFTGSGFNFRFLPNMPVDFRVDAGTLDGENGFTVVEDACEEWDSLSNIGDFCGNLNLSASDITSANFETLVLATDGINDIIFDEDGSIFPLVGAPGALGIGITTTNASGAITDITIIINGTKSNPPVVDLLSTLIHEMGHGWGLAHTPIGGINTVSSTTGLDPISPSGIPTMYPFNIPTDDALGRTLEQDDLGSALLLYGQ